MFLKRAMTIRVTGAMMSLAMTATLLTLPAPALAGSYDVDFDRPTVRVAGSDRFETSVEIARRAFPGWTGVSHVIVASGDGGIPDALTASGLCWAYEAPLLLVSTARTPSSVARALREIASVTPTVTVHLVGGEASLPEQRVAEIRSAIGSSRVARVAGRDRYATASAVAYRMRDVAVAAGRTLPPRALLANGADEAHMVDALVFASVSSGTGMPLLLVRQDSVPPATGQALADLGLATRFVAGGGASVSDAVRRELGARRLAGSNRYATAAAVATEAHSRSWVTTAAVGVAATIPDALSGAGLLGRLGAPLLLTDPLNLPRSTARELAGTPADARAYVLGGQAAVGDTVRRQMDGAPAVPLLTGLPEGTSYCGAKVPITVATGVNTTRVRVYRNDQLVISRSVGSFDRVDLGGLATVSGTNSIRIVAESASGKAASSTRRLTPLGYSWGTYIIIDKSDYRLYWVRNGVLEKAYPIAHGRNGCTPVATWRIDAKYYTTPTSVYGPRKMRMFRQVAPGRFSFTPYAIHGTNQEWVIGTMASAGCIRMYNRDVLELFPQVPLRTMVVTRP